MQTLAEITLPGGARTTLTGTRSQDTDSPVVVILPALGSPAGYYGPFADRLAGLGVTAVSADFPGTGESRPRASSTHNFGYAELAERFLPAVLQAVGREFPGRPLVLLGHSLGGQVGLVSAALGASKVAGIVLIAAGTPYWRAFPRPLAILAQTQMVAVVSTVRRYWPGDRLGFGGRQPRQLMREWARFSRTGQIVPAGAAEDVEAALRRLEIRVLAFDVDSDTLATVNAVDGLLAKVPRASVTRRHFARSEQDGGRPLDHFSWARSPEGLVEQVADWVRAL